MADVSLSSLNPLGAIGIGKMSTMGAILLVVFLALLIIGLIVGVIFIFSIKKKYWIKIHVFRLMGNIPTRIAIYSARDIPFGRAGDRLWKVAPAGINKLKIIKWLPVGKKQTANGEFWYYIREDGEWINFTLADIDEKLSIAGVKYVSEDMRLQRLATDRLLEQRLMDKTFWEKYKETIMLIIFFLVITLSMVIIFYQFSKIIDKLAPLVDGITKSNEMLMRSCSTNSTNYGLLPVR